MQLVPAGTFILGPGKKEVFLDSYYIDQVPVTNAEYMRFVRETGYRPPRYAGNSRYNADDQPVVGIGFNDAVQFAKWAGKEQVSVTFAASPYTQAWTATHGSAPWLALTTDNGTGSGVVRWVRTAANLTAGTHLDTITVTSEGATGSPASIVVTLELSEPVALEDAANHLVLGTGLSAFQSAFLDSVGNQDGTFNLGDVLAWLDRCRGNSPGGCAASSADIERTLNLLGGVTDEAALQPSSENIQEPPEAGPGLDGAQRRQR